MREVWLRELSVVGKTEASDCRETQKGHHFEVGGRQGQEDAVDKAQRTVAGGLKESGEWFAGQRMAEQKGSLEAEGTAVPRQLWNSEVPGVWNYSQEAGVALMADVWVWRDCPSLACCH